MAVIDVVEQDAITIDRMIFHIVGAHLATPDLLEEIGDITPYADFFAERLEAALRGSAYRFRHASTLRDKVKEALENPGAKFVETSHVLARRFQELYEIDRRLSPGALMFFLFHSGREQLAAVLKFDDTRVIAYHTEVRAGRKHPILQDLMHTFVQERTAMQKSAIIRMEDEGGQLICTDRNGQHGDLTDRFRDYLDARRELSHADMTKRLFDAIMATGKACADELPQEVRGQLRSRARQALDRMQGYDPDRRAELVNAVFGGLDENAKVHEKFSSELKKRKIRDEPIRFDTAQLPTTTRRIRETTEGVMVIYKPEDVEAGNVTFGDAPGGRKRIVIETDGYLIDDVLDNKARIGR